MSVSRVAAALSGLVNWRPAAEEGVSVLRGEAAPRVLRRGEVFTALTWNLQYAGSRRHHFFYDGGPDVLVAPENVRGALDAIGSTLAATPTDLVLLQEVDRDSARTGRVDELAALLARLSPAAWVNTPYHRSRYVPHPPKRPLGRMHVDLATLSRLPLTSARRLALPPLREPWIRQEFNLRRAILAADVPVEGGGTLAVANTHLSAFSRGDGTLPAQVARLVAWMDEQRARGASFVLGGDLNVLPPGDEPSRLGAEAIEYSDVPPAFEPLRRFRSVVPVDRLLDPAVRTYLPPGASAPDRVLDYLFVSDDIEVVDARVLPVEAWVSDHLPLRATLRLG